SPPGPIHREAPGSGRAHSPSAGRRAPRGAPPPPPRPRPRPPRGRPDAALPEVLPRTGRGEQASAAHGDPFPRRLQRRYASRCMPAALGRYMDFQTAWGVWQRRKGCARDEPTDEAFVSAARARPDLWSAVERAAGKAHPPEEAQNALLALAAQTATTVL